VKFEIYDGDQCVRFVLGKSGAKLLFIMGINPSFASDNEPDPTIRRVERLTKAWSFDGFVMLNLYPIRGTNPKKLPGESEFNEKLAERNINAILGHLEKAKECQIWASWGDAIDSKLYLRCCLKRIVSKSADLKPDWRRFGSLTKAGNPRHPLSGRPHVITEESSSTSFDVEEYLSRKMEKPLSKS